MSEHLAEPIATATTGIINAAKIGTIGGAVVASGASFMQQYGIALAGLTFTILFGALGLILSHYFKTKEFELNQKLRLKEDARREAEHAATMARLMK